MRSRLLTSGRSFLFSKPRHHEVSADMSKSIWLSAIHADEPSQSRQFVFYRYEDWNETEAKRAETARFGALLLALARGEPFSHDDIPNSLDWAPGSKRTFKTLKPVTINGFLLLRKDVADIFVRHNLGDAQLRPMDLYDRKRTVKFDQQLFAFIPGNDRRTIDTGVKCSAIRAIRHTTPQRFMLGFASADMQEIGTLGQPDDDIACWMDNHVANTLFFSDALVNDLAAAGFENNFFLHKLR